LACCMVCVPWY